MEKTYRASSFDAKALEQQLAATRTWLTELRERQRTLTEDAEQATSYAKMTKAELESDKRRLEHYIREASDETEAARGEIATMAEVAEAAAGAYVDGGHRLTGLLSDKRPLAFAWALFYLGHLGQDGIGFLEHALEFGELEKGREAAVRELLRTLRAR